eukprot:1233934-Amphidinium_carterae.1
MCKLLSKTSGGCHSQEADDMSWQRAIFDHLIKDSKFLERQDLETLADSCDMFKSKFECKWHNLRREDTMVCPHAAARLLLHTTSSRMSPESATADCSRITECSWGLPRQGGHQDARHKLQMLDLKKVTSFCSYLGGAPHTGPPKPCVEEAHTVTRLYST